MKLTNVSYNLSLFFTPRDGSGGVDGNQLFAFVSLRTVRWFCASLPSFLSKILLRDKTLLLVSLLNARKGPLQTTLPGIFPIRMSIAELAGINQELTRIFKILAMKIHLTSK